MPGSPYFHLIQIYFPPGQWEIADCVTLNEDPRQDPAAIGEEGLIDCGHGAVQARSWGLFQILDACWNPAMNPDSPFTPEQWARVLDPNVNTWMASVIWSRGGWKAWTTCYKCDACDIPGGVIPYPHAPLEIAYAPAYPTAKVGVAPVLLGAGIIALALSLLV